MSDPEASNRDGDTVLLTPEQAAARRRRSKAIAIGLAAFVALVFAVTLVRLQGDAANRWNYIAPTEPDR